MTDSREYSTRPIVGVGVVVMKNDAVALVQRGKPPRLGEWTLPGGAIELGETVREAAVREILEECGIEIDLGDVIDVVDILWRDDFDRLQLHYVIVEFVAEYVSGNLRAATDVLNARWVAQSDLPRYDLRANALQVIQKARRLKN